MVSWPLDPPRSRNDGPWSPTTFRLGILIHFCCQGFGLPTLSLYKSLPGRVLALNSGRSRGTVPADPPVRTDILVAYNYPYSIILSNCKIKSILIVAEIAKIIEINAQKLLKNLWKRHLKNLKNLWKSMKTAGPIWMDYLNNAYERNITIRLDSIWFDCKNEQDLANQIHWIQYLHFCTPAFPFSARYLLNMQPFSNRIECGPRKRIEPRVLLREYSLLEIWDEYFNLHFRTPCVSFFARYLLNIYATLFRIANWMWTAQTNRNKGPAFGIFFVGGQNPVPGN